MLPEKKVETQIKNYLTTNNAYFIKTLGGSVPAGTPDILACYKGKFLAIEVKRKTGGKLSALQKQKLTLIQQAGGIAIVACSVEDVKEVFKKLE